MPSRWSCPAHIRWFVARDPCPCHQPMAQCMEPSSQQTDAIALEDGRQFSLNHRIAAGTTVRRGLDKAMHPLHRSTLAPLSGPQFDAAASISTVLPDFSRSRRSTMRSET